MRICCARPSLALNNNAGLAILPLDAAKIRRFHDTAEYFRVAERDGNLAGFLVGFGSHSDHDSCNFAWFQQRYPSFFYIDRIVVASRRRGGGVGRAFYADVQSYAELRYPQMACEVFLDHGADAALLFHGSFGFREVGQNTMSNADGGADVRTSMLLKDLCSHEWVKETYGDKLPDVPWIGHPRLPLQQRPTGT